MRAAIAEECHATSEMLDTAREGHELPSLTVSCGGHAGGKGDGASRLGEEVAAAAAGVVERVLAQLCGKVFSPRLKLLDIAQLNEATGLAPSTIYQLVATGEFPKPIKIGRQNKWRESTLIAWLDRREQDVDQ